MPRRLYFYSNAVDDDIRLSRGISGDSPAATRKIVMLCRALRANGVRAVIVSMGRGRAARRGEHHPAMVGRIQGVPIVYGPMNHRRILSEAISMFWMLAMAIRLSRRRTSGTHLFYNQLIAYLPALTWLSARNQPTLLDIEDGPVTSDRTRTESRGNAPTSFFERLISDGALLACSALAEGTRIRPTMPYYGAIERTDETEGTDDRNWNGPLHILFSGTLTQETGAGLLLEVIRRMRGSGNADYAQVTIDVVGFGAGMDSLSQEAVCPSHPEIRIHGRLSTPDYRALLQTAHIGLSLKPVGGAYADSTFPSKTIEYAEYGLALIATDISDVRAIFGNSACYIVQNDPEELIDAIRQLIEHREKLRQRALDAQRIVKNRFALHPAGAELAAFAFRNGEK